MNSKEKRCHIHYPLFGENPTERLTQLAQYSTIIDSTLRFLTHEEAITLKVLLKDQLSHYLMEADHIKALAPIVIQEIPSTGMIRRCFIEILKQTNMSGLRKSAFPGTMPKELSQEIYG